MEKQTVNEIPRRARLDLYTNAEIAIHNAIQEVEKLPGDTRLTESVTLLSKAKDLVADFVDEIPAESAGGQPVIDWQYFFGGSGNGGRWFDRYYKSEVNGHRVEKHASNRGVRYSIGNIDKAKEKYKTEKDLLDAVNKLQPTKP